MPAYAAAACSAAAIGGIAAVLEPRRLDEEPEAGLALRVTRQQQRQLRVGPGRAAGQRHHMSGREVDEPQVTRAFV